MKKSLIRSFSRGCSALMIGLSLFSCQDLIEVEPENILESDKVYQNRYDADAAVIGIYGEMMNLSARYVLLNELRADLMDVTPNADNNLVELSRHRVSMGNTYADPKPFYKVILMCNDALKNFDVMLAENKLLAEEYNQRYSDIATLRSWLYLQLVTHYGEVPYITEPFMKLSEVQNVSRFPKLTIEQMVKELIKVMEALPWKDPYSTTSSLVAPIDNYATPKFFIHKNLFLGDLYLWDGRYLDAAKKYKDIIEPGTFQQYKVTYADVSATGQDLAVAYIRYAEDDVYSLIDSPMDGWRSMFTRPVDTWFNNEWIWYLPFDSRFAPQNPFVDLFANQGGRYLVTASKAALDRWGNQVQNNGLRGDARQLFSVRTIKGQPVIYKYLYNYDPTDPLTRNGKWWLSRAAQVHLRLAEAANHDNKRKLAMALLNNGIGPAYDNPAVTDERYDKDTYYAYPYNFSARNTNTPYYFRDTYHQNTGVRGRGYVRPVSVPANISVEDSVAAIDNHLINEAALELAFEGQRWGDLVRIAIRRNDPAYLANIIGDKLTKAGDPMAEDVKQRLMNRNNWFLPFRWE